MDILPHSEIVPAVRVDNILQMVRRMIEFTIFPLTSSLLNIVIARNDPVAATRQSVLSRVTCLHSHVSRVTCLTSPGSRSPAAGVRGSRGRRGRSAACLATWCTRPAGDTCLDSVDIARYRDIYLQPGVVLAVQHHVDQGPRPRPRLLHWVGGHLAQAQEGVCRCGLVLVRVCHGAGCGGNCCRGRSWALYHPG